MNWIKLKTKIILIFTFLLLKTAFVTSFPQPKTNKFISSAISIHFTSCALIFAHDNDPNYMSEVEQTLNKIVVPNTLVISGHFIIDIWHKNIINSTSIYSGFDNIYRLNSNNSCSVIVLIINQLRDGIDLHLFNLLTPHYGPLTKKDEDFYFFLSSQKKINQELIISRKFGNKIRFQMSITENSFSRELNLETVNPYKNSGNPEIIQLEEVTSKSYGLELSKLFPDLTQNHFGRGIKMTVPNCQWRFEMENVDGVNRPKRGYYLYWLEAAMIKWNFTYDLFLSSLGGGTGALKNGTWLGAVGDVYYEEAEIGQVVGHIYSRHKYLEWSAPLSYEWMVFVCPKPKTFFSAQAIFWPFGWLTWLLFLICVLLAIGVMKLLITPASKDTFDRDWSIDRIGMYMYTSLLEQDADAPSRNMYDPIRVFCAFWLIFALIVTNSYRAKLVSVIAFPVSSWVPSTFEELAPSTFNMGLNVVGKGGAAYDLFRSSSNPAFQTIVRKMSIHPNALDCLTRAATGDFCCCLWQGISEFEGAKNVSDRFGQSPLQTSTSTTFFIDDGIVYQKRAIFRHHFDKTIWNAIQMGLVNRWIEMDWQRVRGWRNKWEKSVNKTSNVIPDNSQGPKKLQAAHFIGGFAILLSGLGTGAAAFVVEIIKFKAKNVKGILLIENNPKV